MPPSNICVSAITRAEILYGLQRLPENHSLHAAVAAFFQTINVLDWPAAAAAPYAAIRHQLTTQGQPIGEPDMLIAAHALALDATLVTNNLRHYSRIDSQLQLKNWIASLL